MSHPLEIERKFLVRRVWPESEWLTGAVLESKSWIHQTYLTSEEGLTERVRERVWSDETSTLTHTIKRHVANGVNEEDERGISSEEYFRLMTRRHPDKIGVSKIRQVISWKGFKLEVDAFQGPLKGLTILEVELDSMDTPFEPPDFIEVEREVTDDKEFSNASLASKDRVFRDRMKELLDPNPKGPVRLVSREEIQEAIALVDPVPRHPRISLVRR